MEAPTMEGASVLLNSKDASLAKHFDNFFIAGSNSTACAAQSLAQCACYNIQSFPLHPCIRAYLFPSSR